MMIDHHLFIIGLRASGKSSVGTLVARQLGVPFTDLDESSLALLGRKTVQDVFAELGEQAWRAAELRALESAMRVPPRVVALGGGTPEVVDARPLLDDARRSGLARIIYLSCDVNELARRLEHAPGDRPRLTSRPWREEIALLAARREAIFKFLADFEINVTSKSPAQAAAEIVDWIRKQRP